MRRLTILLACILLPVCAYAQSPIKIGQPNWYSGEVVAKVLESIIEDRFDVPVDIVPGTNPEIYGSIAAQDGAYDMHADMWLPGHSNWVDPMVADGLMRISDVEYDGKIGLCTPRYTAETLNLRTVEDLARGDVISALPTDNDGRVPVWVGDEGWQMTAVGTVKLRDYGLDASYKPLVTSEPAFTDELYAAMGRRENIVFACYEPLSWFAMEFIEYIEEPAYDPALHNLVLPSESDNWLSESSVTTGESLSRVSVGYSTRIVRDHPQVAGFLSRFGMTNEDITEFMFLNQIKGIEMDFVVQDWVSANATRVEAWING
ncbi:MAG: glycine betaine ABC transporter substrate-binding protein [Pseudomonadota bacterium]